MLHRFPHHEPHLAFPNLVDGKSYVGVGRELFDVKATDRLYAMMQSTFKTHPDFDAVLAQVLLTPSIWRIKSRVFSNYRVLHSMVAGSEGRDLVGRK